MAIPSTKDLLYFCATQCAKEPLQRNGFRKAIIDHYHLTDEEAEQRTKANNNVINARLGWALQLLKRAIFIKRQEDGYYHITERALEYLASHQQLTDSDLLQYKEYQAFRFKNNKKAKTDGLEEPAAEYKSAEETDIQTPIEVFESAFAEIEESLSEDLLEQIIQQSPSFFEHLVVDLLKKMGYGGDFDNSARVTQYSHDRGIDGIIYEDKLGLDKIYIQAKRWTNPVGMPLIQQFAGALAGEKASKGVFITCSKFTDDAEKYVKNTDKKIVLIDGKKLTNLMIEYNVGVYVKKSYEIKAIDKDFFEE